LPQQRTNRLLDKIAKGPAQNWVVAKRYLTRKLGMRNSLLLIAVSTSALLSGCARNTDQAFKDVAPAATATNQTPTALAPLTQLSQEALARGDAAAAIPLAQRALESAPNNADALLALAQAYLMTGDPVQAEQTFRDVLKNDTKSTVANTGLGLALLSQQRTDEAQTVLRLAAAQKPAAATLSNIAFALALAGAPDEAVKLLDPIALASGSTPQLRQNLAFALVMANNRARAFEVAGYDLDGVSAARQISAWSETARKPFAKRLTEMAGLAVVDRPAFAQAAPAVAEQVAVTAAKPVETTVSAPQAAAVEEKVKVDVAAAVAPVTVEVAETVAAQAKPVAVSEPVVVVKPSVAVAAVKTVAVDLRPVVLRPKAAKPAVETASLTLPSIATVQTTVRSVAKVEANVSKLVGWVVQIGAVTLKTDQSRNIVRSFQASFGKKSAPRVVVVDTPSGKLHRIVLGQSQTKATAVKICSSLKAKGHACFARDAVTLTSQVAGVAVAEKVATKVVPLKVSPAKVAPVAKAQSKSVKI
jgi:D-alanyl-D-alanine carboxypeptidase